MYTQLMSWSYNVPSPGGYSITPELVLNVPPHSGIRDNLRMSVSLQDIWVLTLNLILAVCALVAVRALTPVAIELVDAGASI